MKRVYFVIKANGTSTYHYIDVDSGTAKDACYIATVKVYKSTGKNAFTPFCQPRNPKAWQTDIMGKATEF